MHVTKTGVQMEDRAVTPVSPTRQLLLRRVSENENPLEPSINDATSQDASAKSSATNPSLDYLDRQLQAIKATDARSCDTSNTFTHRTFVSAAIRRLQSAFQNDEKFSSSSVYENLQNAYNCSFDDNVSAGKSALNCRFALGADDDKYLWQGVHLLWTGTEDEELCISPQAALPSESKQAMAQGVIKGFGSLVDRRKDDLKYNINLSCNLLAWLMSIKEIREGILEITHFRNKITEEQKGYLYKQYEESEANGRAQVKLLCVKSSGVILGMFESLLMFLDDDSIPQARTTALVCNFMYKPLESLVYDNMRLNEAFQLLGAPGDDGGNWRAGADRPGLINIQQDVNGICFQDTDPNDVETPLKNLYNSLYISYKRMFLRGPSVPILALGNVARPDGQSTLDNPVGNSKEFQNQVDAGEEIEQTLLGDLYYGCDPIDNAFVEFVLARGLCANRGVHQNTKKNDEKNLYNFPNYPMDVSKSEFDDILYPDKCDKTVNRKRNNIINSVRLESNQLFKETLFDNIVEDIMRDNYEKNADGTEKAVRVRWAPIKKDADNEPYYSSECEESIAICKASVYEHLILFINKQLDGTINDRYTGNTLFAVRAALKLRQLESIVITSSLSNSSTTNASGFGSNPNKCKGSDINDKISTFSKDSKDVVVTRPVVDCGGGTADNPSSILFPVDAGLALLTRPDSMGIQSRVDLGESMVMGNTGIEVSSSDATFALREGLGHPSGTESDSSMNALYVGPSADKIPYNDFDGDEPGLRKWNGAKFNERSFMEPNHVSLDALRIQVTEAIVQLKNYMQMECEEELLKKLKDNNSMEYKEIFGDSKSAEETSRERRSSLWNDALREISVSSDKLLIFVRMLSGGLNESISDLLQGEDAALVELRKDIRERRRELVNRTTQWQSKFSEQILSSLFKSNTLSLDFTGSGLDTIKVRTSDARASIQEAASGSSKPFFESNVQMQQILNSIGNGQDDMNLIDFMDKLGTIGMNVHNQMVNLAGRYPDSAQLSRESLALPRNSFMIRLNDTVVTAINDTFIKLKRLVTRDHPHSMRHIYLWELVEGPCSSLCTRFCSLVRLQLQNTRANDTVATQYVSGDSRKQIRFSLEREYLGVVKEICHYITQHRKPSFVVPCEKRLTEERTESVPSTGSVIEDDDTSQTSTSKIDADRRNALRKLIQEARSVLRSRNLPIVEGPDSSDAAEVTPTAPSAAPEPLAVMNIRDVNFNRAIRNLGIMVGWLRRQWYARQLEEFAFLQANGGFVRNYDALGYEGDVTYTMLKAAQVRFVSLLSVQMFDIAIKIANVLIERREPAWKYEMILSSDGVYEPNRPRYTDGEYTIIENVVDGVGEFGVDVYSARDRSNAFNELFCFKYTVNGEYGEWAFVLQDNVRTWTRKEKDDGKRKKAQTVLIKMLVQTQVAVGRSVDFAITVFMAFAVLYVSILINRSDETQSATVLRRGSLGPFVRDYLLRPLNLQPDSTSNPLSSLQSVFQSLAARLPDSLQRRFRVPTGDQIQILSNLKESGMPSTTIVSAFFRYIGLLSPAPTPDFWSETFDDESSSYMNKSFDFRDRCIATHKKRIMSMDVGRRAKARRLR